MELSVEGYIQNTNKCLKQAFKMSEHVPHKPISPSDAIMLDLEVAVMRECTAKLCRSLDALRAELNNIYHAASEGT